VYSEVTVVSEENIVLHSYVECVKDMFHFCECHSFLPVCTVAKTPLMKNAYITYSFGIMEVSVPSVAIRLYRLILK
jgi:hypothetical protein